MQTDGGTRTVVHCPLQYRRRRFEAEPGGRGESSAGASPIRRWRWTPDTGIGKPRAERSEDPEWNPEQNATSGRSESVDTNLPLEEAHVTDDFRELVARYSRYGGHVTETPVVRAYATFRGEHKSHVRMMRTLVDDMDEGRAGFGTEAEGSVTRCAVRREHGLTGGVFGRHFYLRKDLTEIDIARFRFAGSAGGQDRDERRNLEHDERRILEHKKISSTSWVG